MKKLAEPLHVHSGFSKSTNIAGNVTGMSVAWIADKNKEGEVAYEIGIPIRQRIVWLANGLRCM